MLLTINRESVRAVANGVVVEEVDTPWHHNLASGLITKEAEDADNKYSAGVVVSVGEKIDPGLVKPGDYVLWQKSTAFRIPSGINAPSMFRITWDSLSIIAVLDPEKATPKEELEKIQPASDPDRDKRVNWSRVGAMLDRNISPVDGIYKVNDLLEKAKQCGIDTSNLPDRRDRYEQVGVQIDTAGSV